MSPLEKKKLAMEAIAARKRWDAEGQPPYRERQYYYDGYHVSARPVDGAPAGTWRIAFQVGDSPLGDDWWHATVRELNGGVDVEVLEERWRRT